MSSVGVPVAGITGGTTAPWTCGFVGVSVKYVIVGVGVGVKVGVGVGVGVAVAPGGVHP